MTAVQSTVLKARTQTEVQRSADPTVQQAVADVIADVRARGDVAVREYSLKFDDYGPDSFLLTAEQIEEVMARVPQQVIDDIRFVQDQVRRMAEAQLSTLGEFEIETLPGVKLGQKNVPIDAVGAYVPGGKYPLLASAHMTILTAKVAGATIVAMHLAGADEIYLLGGIQAIAAMAVGTETIEPVSMLAGPGNTFVAEAKRQLFGEVGIDLVAGPTEVLIVADETADPFIVAVDLLSQAEHGPESPAVLIATDEAVARKTMEHIEELLPGMPTRDYAEQSWLEWGEVHVVGAIEDAFALADDYAFEHVQILTAEPRRALAEMTHYGALFLGEGTCVSYGDKSIGTNHVLPTRGAARYTGGLWVGKFLRTVTYQEVTDTESSAFFGELTGRAARVERFEGHARSGDVRAAKYRGDSLSWTDHTF
jgi:sulfopropanediol 3-dehydrogenase